MAVVSELQQLKDAVSKSWLITLTYVMWKENEGLS
jgi:hypothetical protein